MEETMCIDGVEIKVDNNFPRVCMEYLKTFQETLRLDILQTVEDVIVVRDAIAYEIERDATDKEYIESAIQIVHILAMEEIMWIIKSEDYEKKDKSQSVYLIICDECVKIGVSTQTKIRTRHLGTKIPFAVKRVLFFNVENMYKVEKELHKKYEEKRMNGEWFDLSPSDIEETVEHLKRISLSEMQAIEWENNAKKKEAIR